ncbi:VOC family protein [Marivirga arenosa]|uniref:VOC family protein n=1 Tax=Marivirga arenosa TaxID=3059076 RepID=A0AA49JCB6_9BACT|nr:VOC family protein [Marivirga sp. BKB1-2]WKK79573.1 VOC family protein [Marivirga sp. BKB1-2]
MRLGAFSISLAVKDLKVSKEFYEKLGFQVLSGDLDKNYLIMNNENSLVGLFQGMFEENILTFNPGWNENGEDINPFDDVRKIEKDLKSKGLELIQATDGSKEGPANIILKDPDGNTILIDQHR